MLKIDEGNQLLFYVHFLATFLPPHSEHSNFTHPPDLAAPAVHKAMSVKIEQPNCFKASADGFN